MKRLIFANFVIVAALAGMIGSTQEQESKMLASTSADLSYLLASIPTVSPSTTEAVLSASVSQIAIVPSPYEMRLIQIAPMFDALNTMNDIARDVNGAMYRLPLAWDAANRGQYTEARVLLDAGMTLIEEMLIRNASGIERLKIFVDGATRNSIGWEGSAYLYTGIHQIAQLVEEGKKLRDVIYGMNGDYAADRAALAALLTGGIQ